MSRARDLADGTFSGAFEADSPTFVVDAANNRVGVGTASPATKFSVTGDYISQVNAGVSTYLGEDGSGGSLVGTVSNHYFRFITNDTERMRIDSAGRVTMPYQPAFVAVLDGTNQSVGIGNYPCSNALTNIGGHYNTSTYRFTTPVSGLYHFVGGAYFNSGAIHPRVGIRINGAGTNGIMSQNYFDRNDNHLKISWIRYLSAGDYVEMYNDNGTYTVYGGGAWQHTFFSGYLIG